MRRLTQLLLSSLFVLVFGGVCLATDVPKLTGVFNDETNIISAAKRAEITAFLKEQEARTSNQIVVLVVPTINGEEIAEYAGNVFNAWKLGQADKNNGVLVTFARKEGRMRITVGNGLQGALPDLRANRQILEGEEVQSLLKQTKFGSAILATVKAIDREVGGEYQAEPRSVSTPTSTAEKGTASPEDSHVSDFFILLIFALGTATLFYFLIFRRKSREEKIATSGESPRKYCRESAPDNNPNRHRHVGSQRSSRSGNDDDGFLPGFVVGSALSGSHRNNNEDSESRGYSSPSRDSAPPASDPEPYSGGGGSTDWGGSDTSFGGGSGPGAD